MVPTFNAAETLSYQNPFFELQRTLVVKDGISKFLPDLTVTLDAVLS